MTIGRFDGSAEILLTGEFAHRREVVQLLRFIDYITPLGHRIRIDAGRRSDGCSTPWWAWWLAPPIGREARAAFLHDELLRDRRGMTRAQIDQTFRESMRALGTPQWKRNIMWLGVRWQAWRTGDR